MEQNLIGANTIEAMKGMAAELLDVHGPRFNKAFLRSENGKLHVSLGFDIYMNAKGQAAVDVSAEMAFVSERVKDKIEKAGISEIQVPLFPEGVTVKVAK